MFLTPGRCVSTLLAGKRAISTEPSTLKIKYILLFGVQQAFIGSSPSVHKKITFSHHMKSVFFFREFFFGEKGLGFFFRSHGSLHDQAGPQNFGDSTV